MAEELGDDDEVGAAAYERRREGVAQDVDGRVVVEAGGRGDGGDDVVGTAHAEALAALVEKQRGAVVGAGPVVAFVEPAGEGGAQLRVDRDVTDALAFAEDPQDAFARRARDVVDVERDDLADPRAGVERGTPSSARNQRLCLAPLTPSVVSGGRLLARPRSSGRSVCGLRLSCSVAAEDDVRCATGATRPMRPRGDDVGAVPRGVGRSRRSVLSFQTDGLTRSAAQGVAAVVVFVGGDRRA